MLLYISQPGRMVGWLLVGSPVRAELAVNEAVFTDHSGTKCGVIRLSGGTLSVVGEFDCVNFSEGVDVTSDGRWAVIGNCGLGELRLVDLEDPTSPVVSQTIEDTGLLCIEELDIAPDDSFGIATATGNSLVAKFTLDPFEIIGTGGSWDTSDYFGGQPQDVHINSDGDVAVQPMFRADYIVEVDITDDEPVLAEEPNKILPPAPALFRHHGISLSEWDDDTILATATGAYGPYITVASLESHSVIAVLTAPGQPEAVDITCDGSRAVVETSEGLMWLNMTDDPPSVIQTEEGNDIFGPARTDTISTSTVAFSADGSLLFVAGREQIDVYDATEDPPLLIDAYAFPLAGRRIMNVATLPCSADLGGPSEFAVALDIKPQSCPNPINTKSEGVLPVAILGTADVDVEDIDPDSIQLEGVPPLRWEFEDVATPYESGTMADDCLDCSQNGPDGVMDLTLKFDTQEIVAAIGSVSDGQCLPLAIDGQTFDETAIFGEDIVRIIDKKKSSKKAK